MDSRLSLVLLALLGVALASYDPNPASYHPTPAPYHAPPAPKRVSYTVATWGDWGYYGECSKYCGGGERFRYRSCNKDTRYTYVQPHGYNSYAAAPASSYDCRGVNRSMQRCNLQCCPVDGTWTSWGYWSTWAQGHGYTYTRTRSRTCSRYCGGKDCYGDSTQSENKQVHPKPTYNNAHNAHNSHNAHNAHNAHNVRNTHNAHNARNAHNAHNVHNTHNAHNAHNTNKAHNAHNAHNTRNTHNTHNTHNTGYNTHNRH